MTFAKFISQSLKVTWRRTRMHFKNLSKHYVEVRTLSQCCSSESTWRLNVALRRSCTCRPRCGVACSTSVCVYFSGGYKCSDPSWYRVSQDAPGCHPAHREPWDMRRLLGNKPVNHTNEMCSYSKSQTCSQQPPTRRVHGPHTFDYRTSNTPLFRTTSLNPLTPTVAVWDIWVQL